MPPRTWNRSIPLVLVVSVAVACVPTPALPRAEDTPTVVAVPPKTCEGVSIVLIAGGAAGVPLATVVRSGATAAAGDLGADLEFVWSESNPEKMAERMKEAIAARPDGVVIEGQEGDALAKLVKEAEVAGIVVTSYGFALPEIETEYRSSGFGYVGQEPYASGYLLGREAAKRSGLSGGSRALVWGRLSLPIRGLRSQGLIDALKDAGLEVDYMEIDPATNTDALAGTAIFKGYVASNPEVKLICVDDRSLTSATDVYLKAAGRGPDDIFVAGFDTSAATIAAIRAGWTDLVLDQQPYLQGYLPIVQICLAKRYQFAGMHVDTGSGLVDKNNVEQVATLVEKQIR